MDDSVLAQARAALDESYRVWNKKLGLFCGDVVLCMLSAVLVLTNFSIEFSNMWFVLPASFVTLVIWLAGLDIGDEAKNDTLPLGYHKFCLVASAALLAYVAYLILT